jgi:beta-phosphoglucomutase family hydrolase
MVDAIIFDVDGVLTRTAELHYRAWSRLFADALPAGVDPFTRDDYRRLVDGRSRLDGLLAVLVDRGLDTPPDDGLTRLGTRKQEAFLALLAGVSDLAYADAEACLARCRREGLAVAAASSSRNAKAVLDAAALTSVLDVVVDGVDVERLGLAPKPAPDLFLAAAERLGVAPARCALVEDSVAGVLAGRRGGFALVVAVDRSGGAGTLLAIADHTIRSLDDLDFHLT